MRATPSLTACIATSAATWAKTSAHPSWAKSYLHENLVDVQIEDSAALIAIPSVIWRALQSNAPLRIPGKPNELLTWLGKSPLPVATMNAPASWQHMDYLGYRVAHVKTIAFSFIDLVDLLYQVWLAE